MSRCLRSFFRYHTNNVGGADPQCVNDWSRYLPDDWHQSRMLHLLPYVLKWRKLLEQNCCWYICCYYMTIYNMLSWLVERWSHGSHTWCC